MSNNSVDSSIDTNNNLSEYEQHFEWAKEEFRRIEKSKKDTINELAKKLESSGMKLELICSEICRNLEGFASDRYIRESLDEKYKEVKKRNKPIEDDDAEVAPHEEEVKQEITVSNEGQRLDDMSKILLPPSEAEQSPISQKEEESTFSNLSRTIITNDKTSSRDITNDYDNVVEAISIMSKNQARKFMNELRLDILSRLPETGQIEFRINDGVLTYKLI